MGSAKNSRRAGKDVAAYSLMFHTQKMDMLYDDVKEQWGTDYEALMQIYYPYGQIK